MKTAIILALSLLMPFVCFAELQFDSIKYCISTENDTILIIQRISVINSSNETYWMSLNKEADIESDTKLFIDMFFKSFEKDGIYDFRCRYYLYSDPNAYKFAYNPFSDFVKILRPKQKFSFLFVTNKSIHCDNIFNLYDEITSTDVLINYIKYVPQDELFNYKQNKKKNDEIHFGDLLRSLDPNDGNFFFQSDEIIIPLN